MTVNNHNPREQVQLSVPYPESWFSGRNTYATLFLVPAFNLYLDQNLYGTFVNCYIDDTELTHQFSRPLFLLIKTDLEHAYPQIDDYLKNNPSFVYTYTVGRSGTDYLVMYVFECPAEFLTDYDHFLQGQYSKFTENYKVRFNKTVPSLDGTFVESPIYGVIYRTDVFRPKIERLIGAKLGKDQEYFGTYEDKYEIFRYHSPINQTQTADVEP